MLKRLSRLTIVAVTASSALQPAAALVGSSHDTQDASSVVMVLSRQGRSAGFCTGVVLAPDVVMTAAHCVPGGSDVRIHFPDPGRQPTLLSVAAVAIHPGYRANAISRRERSVDLALIRVAETLPSRFQPAALATTSGTQLGARFVFTGYGVGREGDGSSSGVLRTATLPTRAPLSAMLLWSTDPAKPGTGACTGDSGGPVTAEDSPAVAAIMLWSAGEGRRQCGQLTQSLWLAPYRGWIDRTMADWTARR